MMTTMMIAVKIWTTGTMMTTIMMTAVKIWTTGTMMTTSMMTAVKIWTTGNDDDHYDDSGEDMDNRDDDDH